MCPNTNTLKKMQSTSCIRPDRTKFDATNTDRCFDTNRQKLANTD
jgi:hypothetical protein